MKNIVVTGMGVLSPAGYSLHEFWETLYNQKISYGIIDEFRENSSFRIKIAAQIQDGKWAENLTECIKHKYGAASKYAVSTVCRALDDADIDLLQYDNQRIAVVIGTTMGEIDVEENITKVICENKEADKNLYYKYPTYNIVKSVSEAIGAKGLLYAVPAACAAGNYTISIAKNLLDWGKADIVIAGGVDVFSYTAFSGFQRLLSLTPDICRPFDKNRKGLVVGEGCGIVIMERENERVNQKIYGKILGTGLASTAYHMTSPHIEGCGEQASMEKALQNAGLSVCDIDYISAHGTGTKLNDKIEAKVIDNLFGKLMPPVSSIKSIIGHSMGAASVLELIVSLLMIRNNTIIPNANFIEHDDECKINIISNKPERKKLRYIMSNSFAFGGQTSSIVIGE